MHYFLDNFHPLGGALSSDVSSELFLLISSLFSYFPFPLLLSSTLLFSTCIEFYLNSNIFSFPTTLSCFPIVLVPLLMGTVRAALCVTQQGVLPFCRASCTGMRAEISGLHWSSREEPISSEGPSPFLHCSCFSHLLLLILLV